MPDLSPEGPARNAALYKRTLEELEAAPVEGDDDRIAKEVMSGAAGAGAGPVRGEGVHAGAAQHREPAAGRAQRVRPDAEGDGGAVVEHRGAAEARAEDAGGLPASRCRRGLRQKLYASKRQATEGAEQARVWAGLAEGEGKQSFFKQLRETFAAKGFSGALVKEMDEGIAAAIKGYDEMYRYLHGRVPAGDLRARGGGRRPLQADLAGVPGRDDRPEGDVRVGLAGAVPPRGGDAEDVRADHPRRLDGGGRAAAGDGPGAGRRGRGCVPTVAAGAARRGAGRAARHATSTSRSRSARWR